ncbi:hypothetical protein [Aquipuribacter nitratireducens]|uniref:Uncharacterized protein n=1 Tax=Aquipuribacter nitratireducens TaxID=650104 RepID=A0ABW0GNK8_9MICO
MGEDRTEAPRPPYRTPRYAAFLLTGAVLGAVGAVLLALLAPGPEAEGGSTVIAWFAAVGGLLGALVAGVVGVVVEKVVNRGRPDPARRPPGSG